MSDDRRTGERDAHPDPERPGPAAPFSEVPPALRARQQPTLVDERFGVEDPSPPVAASTLPAAGHRARRDWRLLGALSVAGLLLFVAGWFAFASHTNEQAAGTWRQRAVELEEQVNGLRTLIGERSAQLNLRTRQANRLASNLRSTRRALRRSEGDVTSLARRQRELANEKAQLEDQRRALQQQAAALEDIASRYIDCKDSLIDVISSLVYDDYTSASYQIDIARGRCNSAADALSAYLAAYS